MAKQPVDRKRYDSEDMGADRMIENAPKKGGKSSYLQLPKNVTLAALKADRPYRLIMLSWRAGSGNRSFPKGSLAWNRFFECHKYVGPDQGAFVCSQKSGTGPCKACELFSELQKKQGDLKGDARTKYWNDVLKPYKYNERELWLFHDLDGEPKNIQVWDESVRLFGDFLRKKMSLPGKNQIKYKQLAHPTKGSVLVVQGTSKSIGTNSCTEFSTMEIEDRDEELPDWMFDVIESLCVDDMLIRTSYEQQCRICGCSSEDSEVDPDEEGDTTIRNGHKEDDKGSDDEPEPAPTRNRPDAPPASRAPAPKPDEEEEEEEEDEDDPTPPSRPGRPTPPPAPRRAPVIENEDEEPEDEEEVMPTPPKKPKK